MSVVMRKEYAVVMPLLGTLLIYKCLRMLTEVAGVSQVNSYVREVLSLVLLQDERANYFIFQLSADKSCTMKASTLHCICVGVRNTQG